MKRLLLPDVLKGFAVFLIVPVHIFELLIDYPGCKSLFGKILLFLGGPFAVPVFMMIMGYFISKSKKTIAQTLLRGIKIFGLGLVLNIALNFHLLLKIKFAGWQINPLEYIWGVDILYFAGLSVIFLAFLKLVKKGQAWIAFILIFLITGLTGFMNTHLMATERNYILPFIAGTYSWSYFPLFPWLAYPLIGFVFDRLENNLMVYFTKNKWITGIILAVIAGAVLYFRKFGFSTTIYLPTYYHHTFNYWLWAMGVIILWATIIRYLVTRFPQTYVENFLQWLGKNITLFYVIQWIIIGNIATAIYQTQSIGKYVFWFSGIFGVTVLLTWLLEKTHIKLAR
jgi:surface polysaccharide O-acyltransferase-like enzyme